MRVRIQDLWFITCLIAVLAVGCRRVEQLDESERNSRIVAKAYEMSNQGDYEAAIVLFTKALEVYSGLARPHLDLAMLLHERQRDYVRAIYHYSRYLELRPGTEKASMIKGRIRQAERAFASLHTVEGASSGISIRELEGRNEALKRQNTALMRRVEQLEAEVREVRETERQRYMATVVGTPKDAEEAPEAPPPPVATTAVQPVVSSPGTTPARTLPPTIKPAVPQPLPSESAPAAPESRVTPSPVPKPVEANTLVRTYTVRRGDSLSKIAFKVYGDATEWRRLQNANRESLGDSVNVKVGQVLVVP